MKLTMLFAVLFAVASCGKEVVPQDVVDNNMTITRMNSQKNADSYRMAVYPDSTRALMQSDSTVSKDCRYGDGWASGVIELKGGIVKIKCQTNGVGKGINGCMTESEFQTKTYKGEEGSCQNLTSLEKFK